MMTWMSTFKQPSRLRGEMTHDEIMAYLAAEKIKIEKVRDDMLGAIAEATAMVESYSRPE